MCGVAQGDACGIGDCCANPLRKAGAARQIAASGSDYRSDFDLDLDLDLDLQAPSGGREEVLRSGHPGKDAGRAVLGHGWPVTAWPRSGAGAREPERSEGRTLGARPFWFLLWLFDKRDSL